MLVLTYSSCATIYSLKPPRAILRQCILTIIRQCGLHDVIFTGQVCASNVCSIFIDTKYILEKALRPEDLIGCRSGLSVGSLYFNSRLRTKRKYRSDSLEDRKLQARRHRTGTTLARKYWKPAHKNRFCGLIKLSVTGEE